MMSNRNRKKKQPEELTGPRGIHNTVGTEAVVLKAAIEKPAYPLPVFVYVEYEVGGGPGIESPPVAFLFAAQLPGGVLLRMDGSLCFVPNLKIVRAGGKNYLVAA